MLQMAGTEQPVVFNCEDDRLVGILHPGVGGATTGLVIIVGGPQYRVGSHRQFVLMARYFAGGGYPTLRFDYRGMGDSEGGPRTFEAVEKDISAAVDTLMVTSPSVQRVILLGLCDAASAALMYAPTDKRVRGLILLNPWVRTERGEAKAYLRHYYLQRLLQRSFWSKLLAGRLGLLRAMREFISTQRKAWGRLHKESPSVQGSDRSYVARMLSGLESFTGSVLFIISGRDLTGQEFNDLYREDAGFFSATRRTDCRISEIPAADHTLSSRRDLLSVMRLSLDWLAGYK